jgi:hypothetical protein
VLEYASFSNFPATGESGKIYVAIDTNKSYRWSGTIYIIIASDLSLGETQSTAYRGDRGATAYDHAMIIGGNPHGVTKAMIGLGNVENYSPANMPISDAVSTALSLKASSLGQNTITTVGVVTTGTWNANPIQDTYISSAATWNSKISNTDVIDGGSYA